VRTETIRTILRDGALIALLSAGLALGVNALRPAGLPLVADKEYQVLVPCPEVMGEAAALEPTDALLHDPRTLLLDARDAAAFALWHAPGARSVPYDYLTPTPPETVNEILASRAGRVIVVGDGDDPDSGRELARELAGKGLKNMAYVKGGASALKAALTGGRP
jgi:hypothetical protein